MTTTLKCYLDRRWWMTLSLFCSLGSQWLFPKSFFGSLHSPRAFAVWGTTIGNVVNKKAPINNINLLLLHPIVIGGAMGVIG